MIAVHDVDVARTIARLSIEEIGRAVAPDDGATGGLGLRWLLREAATAIAGRPSERLGEVLARFDARIESAGVTTAARETTMALGATVDVDGEVPRSGPVVVVSNHPGAYDALALMSALGRDDVALLAAERPFLRAMPHLGKHLVFVADDGAAAHRGAATAIRASAFGLRQALTYLERGRALVQFGAGAIEPDARFVRRGDGRVLGEWGEGTGMLVQRAIRRGARIIPCFVSGVHSPRAKRLLVVRLAERNGLTTIAPLLQATLPGFRDVVVTIRFGAPIQPAAFRHDQSDRDRTALVRSAVEALAPRPR
jgi:hypothetical protein